MNKLLSKYPIHEELPEGWKIDRDATMSPRGYVFIHNNKSFWVEKGK